MPIDREKDKLIVGYYVNGKTATETAKLVGVSKRTVERKIVKYRNGEMPYCDNVVKGVSLWEKEAEDKIIQIIRSEGYSNIIKYSLEKITPEQVDKELDLRGIRGVTNLVGMLIDKRHKTYTIQLERENLALKNGMIKQQRNVVFMNEEEVDNANHNELPN